ncbi:MAG: OmpA family protein [Deltaproteobacteria bacterium]|nr:OmpA family protein [Deltaproteobacteria bacterium]
MNKTISRMFLLMAGALLIFGCAGPQAVSTFNPLDLNPLIHEGEYIPKVDNFVVILDKSGSMGENYKGQQKLYYAKDVVCRMNQTIPDLELKGALRIFGRLAVFSDQFTKLVWGPATYSKAALRDGLNKVGFSVGDSPMNEALDATAQDLKSAQGNIAVIIFSDANKECMNYDDVQKSAMALKSQYGNRLCIYTVQIGDDPEGKKLLQKVAQEGSCGSFTNADQISSQQGMADFVSAVFLKKAPPKPKPKVVEKKVVIPDSDGDGVLDNQDKCPGTPKGAHVNKFGCWVLEEVLFDFDKHNIKPQYYSFLDQAAAVLKKNPDLKVQIEGHTDNMGSAAYNQKLSLKRAAAVMTYFVSKGIDKERLMAKGYGFSRPVATNETEEGRALNRRVQLTPIK